MENLKYQLAYADNSIYIYFLFKNINTDKMELTI